MAPLSRRFALAVCLAGGIALTASGEGTPVSPSASTDSSSAQQSYVTVGDIVGEIVKVDGNSITVRVTWYTAQPPKNTKSNNRNNNNRNNHHGNWNRGTSNRNPQQMYQHMMMMQQQLMRNAVRNQQQAANAKPQEHHQDYVMNFTADANARVQHLPPKTDDSGKKVPYTPAEAMKLKGNPPLPGYRAELSELKPGQLVEAHVVRTLDSKKTKDTSDDHLVRWALILNENHVGNPPSTNTAATPKKKN